MTVANTQASGSVSAPHVSHRSSSRKVFSAMFGSRRSSAAPTPAESRRGSTASSVGSNKSDKSNKDSKDDKTKLPARVMPRVVMPSYAMPSYRSPL
ncbi:hypothetical protein E4U43_000244 [Claviceps pusilla]|uniref:Uncharacterized protein n=1 Tax=Claviceps pusilla TaxID=123648 RepID=A0A9P7T078_9HYPO|nr:hypothetical protein E4U43_000244 [Claviceps pusilla]